ncbi:MAG: fibrobacter succinogenes major paralogous domain-containing protein [Fibromonadaceae bacterium]|jgi:uncharacterized protein (TIGR02145 family)|nr:fibrobacter succinogenes major paralogous domain-containing protein [Fibromonadaceae bacterium]
MRTQFSKIALVAIFGFALTFTLSCSGGGSDDDGNGNSSSPSDVSSSSSKPNNSSSSRGGSSSSIQSEVIYGNPVIYQGETYQTVVIGTQTWFNRNLNYAVAGSVCGGNDPANCDKYGRLYNWETAIFVCPSSWHLPSRDEWDVLVNFAGSSSIAGTKLKATSGWNSYSSVPSGTDAFGFSALPGGWGSSAGNFYGVGNYGNWWSSSEDAEGVYGRLISDEDEEVRDNNYWGNAKSNLLSVRCLKDD